MSVQPTLKENSFSSFEFSLTPLSSIELPLRSLELMLNFRDENFVSYPMTKESPFTKSIMETVERLRSHGILDHLWKNYLPLIDKEKCKERKVSVLCRC